VPVFAVFLGGKEWKGCWWVDIRAISGVSLGKYLLKIGKIVIDGKGV
jgi:hypothetical protein